MDKRKEIRIPLLSEAALVFIDGQSYHLEVDNISSGGIYFKSIVFPKAGSTLMVTFELPEGLRRLELLGKVKRINWRKTKDIKHTGFALCFDGLITENTKRILNPYIAYLRNKQIISVSKRIIKEFFPNQK